MTTEAMIHDSGLSPCMECGKAITRKEGWRRYDETLVCLDCIRSIVRRRKK